MKWKAPHYPGHPQGGEGRGKFPMTSVLIRFSNSCKNDKRNSNLFFNKKQCKNEKGNWNPFFKMKWKWKTKLKRNSYPFFKVMRKRKTKYEVQFRFSKLIENEKQKAKFKSVFQCHVKTKNVNGIWIPFSHAIEKRLALRYTHLSQGLLSMIVDYRLHCIAKKLLRICLQLFLAR